MVRKDYFGIYAVIISQLLWGQGIALPPLNLITQEAFSREYYGLYVKYTLEVAGQKVKAVRKNDGTKQIKPGDNVTVSINPDDLMIY